MHNVRRKMRLITRFAQSYAAETLAGTDLSRSQFEVLRTICFNNGINQQSIANRIGIDKAAVARTTEALEQGGYIKKEPDPADGRAKLLWSTEKGVEARDRLIESEDLFFTHIFNGISQTDIDMFVRVLDSVYDKALDEKNRGFSGVMQIDTV